MLDYILYVKCINTLFPVGFIYVRASNSKSIVMIWHELHAIVLPIA